jgi:hypothetical protein
MFTADETGSDALTDTRYQPATATTGRFRALEENEVPWFGG